MTSEASWEGFGGSSAIGTRPRDKINGGILTRLSKNLSAEWIVNFICNRLWQCRVFSMLPSPQLCFKHYMPCTGGDKIIQGLWALAKLHSCAFWQSKYLVSRHRIAHAHPLMLTCLPKHPLFVSLFVVIAITANDYTRSVVSIPASGECCACSALSHVTTTSITWAP